MKLYSYQVEGVDFLARVPRAVLADDMGLGKTAQVIEAAKRILARRILVVCPKSLAYNWSDEIERWYPIAPVTVLDGTAAKRERKAGEYKFGFLIVNYELARPGRDGKGREVYPKGIPKDFDMVVFDEAHRLKNRKALQTKGARFLARETKRVVLVTGTPIQNRVADLWSLLNIIDPKKYSSFWKFVKLHANAHPGVFGWEMQDGPTDPARLAREIAPAFLRREKGQVGKQLPPKTYQKLHVGLDATQSAWYEDMQSEMIASFSDESRAVIAPQVITQILRLKQVCVSPALVDPAFTGYLSPKLEAMLEIVEGTDKVVVFSQFAVAVREAALQLKKWRIPHVILTGDVPTEERREVVRDFQTNPNTRVFLATIQAGGEGITLTAASTAVFLDKHWTPATNLQASDRLHRVGQERPVTVVELLARDTVEDWIEELLDRKLDIISSVVDRLRRK